MTEVRSEKQIKENYHELVVKDYVHGSLAFNHTVQHAYNEVVSKAGKMIGIEAAILKTLNKILYFNNKSQKLNLALQIELARSIRINRNKIKKIYQLLDINDNESTKFRIDEIKIKTEKDMLALMRYYLLGPNGIEQTDGASRSSQFICISESGDLVQQDSCHYY